MGGNRNYRIGIDVGLNSLGLAAIEYDDNEMPTEILNCIVVTHDAGIDPDSDRSDTRLNSAGVARRARRRLRQRSKRLELLEQALEDFGFLSKSETQVSPKERITNGLVDSTLTHPLTPWNARRALATSRISDDATRNRHLSIAFRHIARHRGWRNPYSNVAALRRKGDPTDSFYQLVLFARQHAFADVSEASTIGQIVACVAEIPGSKIRDKRDSREKAAAMKSEKDARTHGFTVWEGGHVLLSDRTMQRDLANEVHAICDVQRVDESVRNSLIDIIFAMAPAKGKSQGLIGTDELPGQELKLRCSTAADAFQKFRIAATLANLRVEGHRLSPNQLQTAFDYLAFNIDKDEPTWIDVAKSIDVDPGDLNGVARRDEASLREDGTVSARPPVHETNRIFAKCQPKAVRKWWQEATIAERDALVVTLSNQSDTNSENLQATVDSLLSSLSPADVEKLESIKLPSKRAAYSKDSLNRLTEAMLMGEGDVHSARKKVFSLPDNWLPKAEPIGQPVNHPSVDRVLKALARWIMSIEKEYGTPERVYIEHVRDGFKSKKVARQIHRENERRFLRKQELRKSIERDTGRPATEGDLVRHDALIRQNHRCLYCDSLLTAARLQMDHIVPQRGVGSNNKQSNLVAVCERCNRSKSNRLFSEWATQKNISVEECVNRLATWNNEYLDAKRWNEFIREVESRLRRKKSDPEFDGRSMESVAWMARLAADRIDRYFWPANDAPKRKTVFVYPGRITASARKVSGFVEAIPFVGGGKSKTRLDKRHHAMDAAIITTLNDSVARTLLLRDNLKLTQSITRGDESWKTFRGNEQVAEFTGENVPEKFDQWKVRSRALATVFAQYVENDKIPILSPTRLRLANASAHKETLDPLHRRQLKNSMSVSVINNACSPALWCALTQCDDFDEVQGLPANDSRIISVNGTKYGPEDEVAFFQQVKRKDKNVVSVDPEAKATQAAVAVRNGFANVGSRIHHARIYRIETRQKDGTTKTSYAMVRVFAHDLRKFQKHDLFSVPLAPHSLSIRGATQPTSLKKALINGSAHQVGWLVAGDELKLDLTQITEGAVLDLLNEFPGTSRWKVTGFSEPGRLQLKPLLLASEGLPTHFKTQGLTDTPVGSNIKTIVETKGWRISPNDLFTKCKPTIIRRDSLGRIRTRSAAHLPVTWSIIDDEE